MAPIMDPMVADLAAYLESQIGIRFELHVERDWRSRGARVDQGEMELAWVCGLPYARKVDQGGAIQSIGSAGDVRRALSGASGLLF